MPLDSDENGADNKLFVEFYEQERMPDRGKVYVRIMVPGDKLNIIDTPVRDYHKERFPRQWLHYSMKANEGASAIGVPLLEWAKEAPDDIAVNQLEELTILKFQTVEQVATATDAQLQRVGMGAVALQQRARAFLQSRNKTATKSEMDELKAELAAAKAAIAELAAKRGPGRPRTITTEE